MKHLPVDPELYKKNRQRFVHELAPQSIAIFNSNDELNTNGDALYPFEQNADLKWLTGIEQEDTMLVLFPDNPDQKHREVLVLVRPDELKEKWNGHRLTTKEGSEISGIKKIIWLDEFPALLQKWMHEASLVYLNSNENDKRPATPLTRDYRFAHKLQKEYPLHTYRRAAPILKKLRSVKTAEEVKVMKKAINITDKAFRRILEFIRPGVYEFEIQAEVTHEFLRNRASGEGYASIFASGDRARTLHYIENNQECKDGELILMDFGARYGYYNADLSRTIPINGKFTKRQREVYEACLRLHKYANAILKPGITINEYHHLVGIEAGKEFVKLGLLTEADIKHQNPDQPAYRKYLYHGISHHLGIDVHDLGPSYDQPIPEDAVMTIEPGIYIEEEQIGIRIENNYWVRKNGNIDLMAQIPIEAHDIEAFMNN